ncbi:MAG: thioredoxin domain-containing protein [Elusimicrobia bacterium]|nr:thioredoxin domain-containing protein [Elusimicrobiota bacterium]
MRSAPNRLAGEKSPYLQQHAGNPVDWFPWGEEAFSKARKENKPVFLSIGYSTCHWCHVMERESFSSESIAEKLNRNFVPIKVDREERPDVDRIYMTAVQILTGQGGWPLNAFLTPELKPFYGGTYFPPDSMWGRPGFGEVLEKIADLWSRDRETLAESGEKLTQAIREYAAGEAQVRGLAGESALKRGFESYKSTYDAVEGGFGGAPKFPMPVDHMFLMRYWARTQEKDALDMSINTLRKMARGGIQDHLGGGFHRYSTDERWHIPHFEKMLYDNAQLASVYLDAYQITGDEEFARTARAAIEYVLRDLRHKDGGFYSAEDADSLPPELAGKVEDHGHIHRTEGAFYLWTKAEVVEALGADVGERFCRRYGVEPDGNAQSDPHGEFSGKNILFLAEAGAPADASVDAAKAKLLEIRNKRPRPHLDDKVLASWNGLMLSALSKAASVLDDKSFLEAALEAGRFIQEKLYDPDMRRLYRRWRNGERAIAGTADDYAFIVQGFIDLYESSFDACWLARAETLADEACRLFYDTDKGGFFMTSKDHDPNLLARIMEEMDNVEPSASSVMATNLLRLSQYAARLDYQDAAEKTLARFSATLTTRPRALPQMLTALGSLRDKPRQIVIAGEPGAADTQALLRVVRRRFLPNSIVILADGGINQQMLSRRTPFLKDMTPSDGKAAAYVCVNFACKLSVNEPAALESLLAT